VARLHLAKIGVKLTQLRKDQADYIGVKPEGPFKSDHYDIETLAGQPGLD